MIVMGLTPNSNIEVWLQAQEASLSLFVDLRESSRILGTCR
uniref:Uncharacterized protein n=1 Tax=Brassica campestris TaxID=3711 RepID=A0A3P6AH31_BRACM|nr:unnamed protein product [Brassica rapa]